MFKNLAFFYVAFTLIYSILTGDYFRFTKTPIYQEFPIFFSSLFFTLALAAIVEWFINRKEKDGRIIIVHAQGFEIMTMTEIDKLSQNTKRDILVISPIPPENIE